MATIAQTFTQKFPKKYQEGQRLAHPAEVIASKLVDEENGIRPGRAVVRGTDPAKDVSLPAPADIADGAIDAVGIALLSSFEEMPFVNGIASEVGPYVNRDPLAVTERGRVAVISEDAATAGGLVYVRVAGAGELGGIRATAVADETAILTGWKFADSTTVAAQEVEIVRW